MFIQYKQLLNRILVKQPVRYFGVADTIIGMASNTLNVNRDKQFGELVKLMVDTPNWTLRPWKKTMESQLSSWTMYIPGVGSSDEVKNIKKFKEMLDAMTDSELDSPETINGVARQRISAKSGHPTDDVARMLYFFKQSLVMHTWLEVKKIAGERLPQSEGEILEMQENDSRIIQISKKILTPSKKRGRGRGVSF